MQPLLIALIVFIVIYILLFLIGLLGFRYFYDIPWIDAFLNLSNTITGNTPFLAPSTKSSKWFAAIYLIISHIVFILLFALLVAYIVDYTKMANPPQEQETN